MKTKPESLHDLIAAAALASAVDDADDARAVVASYMDALAAARAYAARADDGVIQDHPPMTAPIAQAAE